MSSKKFVARFGLDNNNQTLSNVANPVLSTDAVNKGITDSITNFAQSAYNTANNVGTQIQPAYDKANSAYDIGSSASSNTIYLSGALDQTNTNIVNANTQLKAYVDGQITNTLNYSNGIDDAQNTRISTVEANTIYLFGALDQTNTSITSANTQLKAYVDGEVSYISSINNSQNTNISTATNLAQGAYDTANLKFNTSGGTITGPVTISSNLTITGNLTVAGNVTTVSANNLIVTDNMIYLNDNNQVTNPDLGFAGNYNDGIYRHAGFFRDASDGYWKVFDQYLPEPDASPYIDTSNASFRIADFQANNVTFGKITSSSTQLVSNLNADYLDGQHGSYYTGYTDTANTSLRLYAEANTGAALTAAKVYTDNANNAMAANTSAINTFVQSAYNTANSASSNTIYQSGVDSTQNTNITAVNSFAQSAYNQANTDYTTITTTAGYYGGTTQIPIINLAANGRISSISNTSITAGATITDDTTTNAARYIVFDDVTSGAMTSVGVSSTKLTFNPSTGTLTSTAFSGSGASLTSLTAGNLSGTIPSAVLGNSTAYVGTTAIALNRASGSQSLTGVSIDGSAGSVAASALTGTTLASGVTGSSLTSVGTITSGTWSGSFGAVSGANLTGLTAGNLSGTIPSAVLGNSTAYVGTTAIALNRSSAAQSLTGVSISGDSTSSSSLYALPDTGGTAQWIFLGTWSSAPQSGSKVNIELTIGAGYNASIAQNSIYKIFFKTSNNSSSQPGSSGNFYADGMAWRFGPSGTVSNLRVIQNSSSSYAFYINCGSFTGVNSVYTISLGQGVWTNSSTLASPSGNYIDLPIYMALDSNNYNSYAPTLTGTGASGSWGISVTGSAGSVAAGNITGTTLASGVTGSSLTSVGTITSGTWSGSFGAVSGANLTALNASNLGSGTVPTARLGTGTADSTTYLRGDNTWATVSGGATITDDTTTNATRYIVFDDVTSGSMTAVGVSSTKLYFNPSTGTTYSTLFQSLSDETQKTNIVKIENATDTIKQIDGFEFDWKDNGNKSAGVIAQQLEKILPWLVTENEGVKSVNYSGLIAYLIQSNKELADRIEKLENR